MKRYVEIEPICPFIGKPCIRDGWQWNAGVYHPCAFYDADNIYKGVNPEEPCRIKRAVNRILADEVQEQKEDTPIKVPFDTQRR